MDIAVIEGRMQKTRRDTRRPIKARLAGGGAVCVCVRARGHVYVF